VIGHTKHDIEECKRWGASRGFHQPAPTTLLHENWGDFDGDIITCHSNHYNAKYVCSIEVSQRFCAADGTLVLAESKYVRKQHMKIPGELPKAVKHKKKNQKIITFKQDEYVGYDG